MRLSVLRQIALTTFREFIRSKEAVFWTYGFPVLMAVVLGLAFGRSGNEPSRVAIVESETAGELLAAFDGDDWVEAAVHGDEDARGALATGSIDAVLSGTPSRWEVWFDESRAASRLARLAVERRLSPRAEDPDDRVVHKAKSNAERYIDFLIPGLIGLNLLGAGMWGVGFNLVDMRIKNLMRRLVVAPMHKAEFLFGFLLSRMGMVVFDAFAILAFGWLVFDVPVHGSWLLLGALFVLGGLATSALGLVVAARPTTVEGVSGVMNLVTLPMWLMGGSFFKTSYFPDYFRPVIEVLPLTHINDALRAVMLEGAGVAGIWPQMLYLAAFAAAGFAVALRFFRWT